MLIFTFNIISETQTKNLTGHVYLQKIYMKTLCYSCINPSIEGKMNSFDIKRDHNSNPESIFTRCFILARPDDLKI